MILNDQEWFYINQIPASTWPTFNEIRQPQIGVYGYHTVMGVMNSIFPKNYGKI